MFGVKFQTSYFFNIVEILLSIIRANSVYSDVDSPKNIEKRQCWEYICFIIACIKKDMRWIIHLLAETNNLTEREREERERKRERERERERERVVSYITCKCDFFVHFYYRPTL